MAPIANSALNLWMKKDNPCASRTRRAGGPAIGNLNSPVSMLGESLPVARPLWSSQRPGSASKQGRRQLLELVEDVVNVIGDNQNRGHGCQPHRRLHDWLNLVDFVNDCRLRASFVTERVIEEDLILFVPREPGPVQVHNRKEQNAEH